MSGKTLMIGLLSLTAVFAAVLWYFQIYAYYDDLEEQPLVVQGTTYPVESWQGIDAISSPLKRRVCLTLTPESATRIRDEQFEIKAEPLVAPSWFECFDAKALSRDLQAGKASAYMTGPSGFEGVDDYLAVYPDGRAFIWRQLHPKYANQ